MKTVKDAVGLGDKSHQRQAQEILALMLYKPFKKLIDQRYQAYYHIGGVHEREDDLQRLYMYIFYGHRETSRGELNPNKPPMVAWLESLESSEDTEKKNTATDLKRYVITKASAYLKIDLPRNILRGRGHETLVRWNEEESADRGETAAADRMERSLQSSAHETVHTEKIYHAETLELRRCVRECLDLMPAEDAALLLAKHCEIPDENFTQVEYARKVGISESTVSRRLARGEENLASLLRSRCPDLLERFGWLQRAESDRTTD